MKRTTLLTLVFLTSLSLLAQDINFDNGYLERVHIDSTNPDNIWQIGHPQKAMFDSAFSMPNVIVTDTSAYYPTNNNSVFYVYYPWHDLGWVAEMSFKYKIQSDTLLDFGYVEASYDHGNTWVDVMQDAVQYELYWDVTGRELPGGNHEIIAYYDTDTLPFTGSSDTWYTFNLAMFGWDMYFPYEDTIIYKISFHSDGVETGKEGWMIDNILTTGYYVNIEEYNNKHQQIVVFPNPCTEQLTIKMLQSNNSMKLMKIFKMDGSLVRKIAANSNETTIDINDLENGYYLFQTIDKEGEILSGKFLKR